MRLLVIGYDLPGTACVELVNALKFQGHHVLHVSNKDIQEKMSNDELNAARACRHPLKLSYIDITRHNFLDAILIVQHDMNYFNDVETPVVYYQREMTSELGCRNPDAVLFDKLNIRNYMHRYYPWEWSNIPVNRYFPVAVNPGKWDNTRPRDLRGMHHVGVGDKPPIVFNDWLYNKVLEPMRVIPGQVPHLRDHSEHLVSNEEYKDIIERAEKILVVPTGGHHVSRRVLEACASGAEVYLHAESDACLQEWKQLGFTFEFSEEPRIYKVTNPEHHLEHTYLHRAQQLEDIISSIHVVKARQEELDRLYNSPGGLST
jgi:hypothetical protein